MNFIDGAVYEPEVEEGLGEGHLVEGHLDSYQEEAGLIFLEDSHLDWREPVDLDLVDPAAHLGAPSPSLAQLPILRTVVVSPEGIPGIPISALGALVDQVEVVLGSQT